MTDGCDSSSERDKPLSRAASSNGRRGLIPSARAASALEMDRHVYRSIAEPSTEPAWPGPVGRRDQKPGAALIRARLGSYQRGLADARKVRQKTDAAPILSPIRSSLFITTNDGGADSGSSAEKGGDQ